MAGALAFLIDLEQQRVTIAVIQRLADELSVARRVTLAPHLLATAAPKHGPTLVECLGQRFFVHPGHHQDLATRDFLNNCRDESVLVVTDGVELFCRYEYRCGGEHLITVGGAVRDPSAFQPTRLAAFA